MARESVVVLSTADYDAAVWTNKQHIAQRLASTFDVYYVNSLGLRQPRVAWSDLKRITGRLLSARKRGGHSDPSRPPNLRVISPWVLPFHRYRLVRGVNRLLIRLSVVRRLPSADAVLWTFSAATYGLEKRAARVVYHSVDLLHTFPGIPGKWFIEQERNLVRFADVVIASSSGVEKHLRSLGCFDVELWPNVADTALYGGAAELGLARKPRAIFAGNLTSAKVDFALLKDIADGGVEVALAGPVSIDGSRDGQNLARLMETERVTYLGNLSPSDLAKECATSMVGLIPYLQNDYTSGVYPMKLYEYLAAGLAVVSTPLPSLRDEGIVGFMAGEGTEFVAQVRAAIQEFSPDVANHRRRAAMDHSWECRLDQVRALLGP